MNVIILNEWFNMPQGHPMQPIKCRKCSFEKKAPNSKCPNKDCIMSTPGIHNEHNKSKPNKSKPKKSKPKKLKPKKLEMRDLPSIESNDKWYNIEHHEVPFNLELNDTKVRLAIKKKNIKRKFKQTNKDILNEVTQIQNRLTIDVNILERMIYSYIYTTDNIISTDNIYKTLNIIKNKLKKSEDVLSTYI